MTGRVAQQILATGFSAIFSPPLTAAGLSAFLVMRMHMPWPEWGIWLSLCFIFLTCLPVLYMGFLLKQSAVDSFFVANRAERPVPLLVSAGSCLAGFVLLYINSAPLEIQALVAGYVALGLVAAGVTLRWKVSLHAAGVWGPMAVLFYLLGLASLFWLPVSLAVCWARVCLKAHSLSEVLAGGGLGFGVTGFIFAMVLGA